MMIKNIALISLILGACLLRSNTLQAGTTAQSTNAPIIVELFTSQGCSSCPPADQMMNQLTANPNLIPLSYHVTYWDRPHWKDSLGHIFADDRQRSYADYNRSTRLYTPQMLINGGKPFIGSHKDKAKKYLHKAKPLSPISISAATPTTATITLPQLDNSDYHLWLAGVKSKHIEKITRGENRGKDITYTNAVLSLKKTGQWDGNAKTITLTLDKTPEIDHYVIFAQIQEFGEIVAAGKFGI